MESDNGRWILRDGNQRHILRSCLELNGKYCYITPYKKPADDDDFDRNNDNAAQCY